MGIFHLLEPPGKNMSIKTNKDKQGDIKRIIKPMEGMISHWGTHNGRHHVSADLLSPTQLGVCCSKIVLEKWDFQHATSTWKVYPIRI